MAFTAIVSPCRASGESTRRLKVVRDLEPRLKLRPRAERTDGNQKGGRDGRPFVCVPEAVLRSLNVG